MMLRRSMMAAASGGATDPYWANVVSLLHFDSADGSSTFTDQVPGVTWTRNGAAQMDDQFQLFGNNGQFTGTGDDIVCNTNWRVESDDFTLDISYRPSSVLGNRTLFYNGNPAVSGNAGVLLRVSATSLVFAMLGGTSVSSASGVITLDAWNRIRVCRDSTSTRLYVNGTQVASGVQADGANSTVHAAKIGSYRGTTSDNLNGRIDEFRLTMGVARTTGSSYTVEASPFPNS